MPIKSEGFKVGTPETSKVENSRHAGGVPENPGARGGRPKILLLPNGAGFFHSLPLLGESEKTLRI